MSFWFYNTPMTNDYCSKDVNLNIKSAIVSWLLDENVDNVPNSIGEVLDEVRCLQNYLCSKRPKIIDLRLYTGETESIVINGRHFYYVDKIDDVIVIRGIAHKMFVKYDLALSNFTGEIMHYPLQDAVTSSDDVDREIKIIVSKFFSKEETSILETMGMF